jgi:hypothetical protein
MSAPVEDYNGVQKMLRKLDSDDITDFTDFVLPDQIPASRDINRGSFGLLRDTSMRSRLGNDLHNLPRILVQNYFEAIQGLMHDLMPVESGARALKHRVSLIQLRHQADRLGLSWNPSLPWQFHLADESATHGKEIHPADLVPDYPSDWIPYDPEMTHTPWDFEEYFNTKEHEAFYKEHYACLHFDDPCSNPFFQSNGCDFKLQCRAELVDSPENVTGPALQSSDNKGSGSDARATWPENFETSRKVITNTVRLLKDGGNLALQERALDLAAIRYDKALRYSAVASMGFPSVTLKLANYSLVCDNGGCPFFAWDELAQLIIRTRLNLALLFLMPHFSMPKDAVAQAQNALHDLGPFCTKKGKIMKGRKLTSTHVDSEPEETYLEAKALQAKAYFRLGSAHYELAEFSDAIISYESSVNATEEAKAKPDKLVLRRLAEAKRESRRARKRERTKFEFGFSGVVSPDNNKSGRANDSDAS